MTNYHVVFLQGDYSQVPDFELPAPHTYTKTVYPQTTLSQLHERIHDASILVFSKIELDAIALSPEVTPHLKLIVVVATGTDCVDLEVCRRRGIAVSNCPSSNVEAVSEHAIGLYFTTRRKMLQLHSMTRAGEWPRQKTLMYRALNKDGTPPLTCQEEVVGIIGNGNVGKRIAGIARGLGMKVLISGRKNDSTMTNGENRTPFDTVVKQSTVLFLALPLTDQTRHLISTPELEAMLPCAVVINVSRGGIVDEDALVKALQKDQIAGAATDVFSEEPSAPDNSALLREDSQDLNLVVTPHLAWLSQMTFNNYSRLLQRAVEGWSSGSRCNIVV